MVDSGQGITYAAFLAFIGFLLVPVLLDFSARLTGIIFLVFGIFVLLYIYDPSALTMILGQNPQNTVSIYTLLASIKQEGATYFGSFLVGTGLGLLFFYPALRRPARRR